MRPEDTERAGGADAQAVADFLLACHAARRVTALLPELPQGVGPRDIRILDTIGQLERERGSVRVSDVSERMEVSRPAVSRDLARLDARGLVEKAPGAGDGRQVLVSLTPEGARVRQTYVTEYHEHLADVLADVGSERLEQAAATIREVRALMEADRAAGGSKGER